MMNRTHAHYDEPLKFVRFESGYTVYRDRAGEVFLGPGGVRMVHSDRLWEEGEYNLRTMWREYKSKTRSVYPEQRFLERLEALLVDSDDVIDEIVFCADCNDAEHSDDTVGTENGSVCDSCSGSYTECYRCDNYYRYTTETLDERQVCEGCRNRHYSWCDYCEGYGRDEDDHDHEDDDDDDDDDDDPYCCSAPDGSLNFYLRNDGNEPLRSDQRITVTLPAGVISDEGIGGICSALRFYAQDIGDIGEHDSPASKAWQLAYNLEPLGDRWQAKDGNYTKRLSRFAYKEYGLKLAPSIISEVGNIFTAHSGGSDCQVEFTRYLNMSAADFYHEESCWWESYTAGRCALKSNGGFGMRTFTDYTYPNGQTISNVSGRAWVQPLKLVPGKTRSVWSNDGPIEQPVLTPTFETMKPDAFMIFNGYGDLEGYAPARIMSHMAGMTYRKIEFNASVSDGSLYINSGSGYLIAPEEIAAPYTDSGLPLSWQRHADLWNVECAEEQELTNA